MRQALPNHLLHNPFHNRFNVPVTHRHDEMQAQAYVWLRDHNQGRQADANISNASAPNSDSKLFGIVVVMLMVIVTGLILLKAF